MMTRRLILAVAVALAALPLAGCRHNKCCSPSASYAPPPPPCNDCDRPSAYLPPGR